MHIVKWLKLSFAQKSIYNLSLYVITPFFTLGYFFLFGIGTMSCPILYDYAGLKKKIHNNDFLSVHFWKATISANCKHTHTMHTHLNTHSITQSVDFGSLLSVVSSQWRNFCLVFMEKRPRGNNAERQMARFSEFSELFLEIPVMHVTV